MSDSKNRTVFISYSREDSKFVDALAEKLKADDISVWSDRDLVAGSNWRDEIASAMQDAKFVIFVVSQNSMKSSWQNMEIGMALQRQHESRDQFIIPVLLGSSGERPEVPGFLRDRMMIDAGEADADKVASKVAEVVTENQ
jgi:hypothetical protein